MWYCSECGKKNTGKFCTKCGTRYIEVDEEFAKENDADYEEVVEDEIIPQEMPEIPETDFDEELPEADSIIPEMENGSGFFGAFLLRLKAKFHRQDVDTEDFADGEADSLSLSDLNDLEVSEAETTVEAKESDADFEEVETHEAAMSGAVLEDGNIEESDGKESAGTAYAEELLHDTAEVIASEKAELFPPLQAAEEVPFFDEEAFVQKVRASATSAEIEDDCRSPFLNNGNSSYEGGGNAAGIRRNQEIAEEISDPETNAVILEHHLDREADSKEDRVSKRMLIIGGAVCGVVLLVLFFLITSLFVTKAETDGLPTESGVYYYVSGAEDTINLYADKSLNSDVLAELENGICVEYLAEINYRFDFVKVRGTGEYGYVLSEFLVDNIDSIVYNDKENSYKDESFLGYWYVTKTEKGLTLWENAEGNGNQKATLQNGFKVSVLEKTNDKYWLVFDYNSAERGYVRSAYLTDKLSKVIGAYTEPSDKTIIGDMFVVNVSENISLRSQPSSDYGTIRAKVKLNGKVGLIQKTTNNFWYVYDYATGSYGYVAAKYLSETDPQEAERKKQEEEKQKQEAAAHTVKVGDSAYVAGTDIGLAIRAEASQSAAELGHLNNGDWVTVVEDTNSEFWLVKTNSGVQGYVLKAYIKK